MAFESLTEKLQNVFKKLRGKGRLTEEDVKTALKEVKMALLEADVNFKVVKQFTKAVQERAVGQDVMNGLNPGQMVVKIVNEELVSLMGSETTELPIKPGNEITVLMMAGLQGAGKTTTVAKIAGKLKSQGKKVMIAAADTFRAAAGEQLKEWANRASVDMIGGQEGADPASVIYDAVAAAKARKVDVLLCDTAGRLHNKKNLMEELKKINRVIDREYPEAFRETLVVLDATTGQNALAQAREFNEAADITGVVLTKMDGTAKGGIAVAIQAELGIPVKYIGVGETIDDLQKFDSEEFVKALFYREED